MSNEEQLTIFGEKKGVIQELMTLIDNKTLGRPELQRPFVWGDKKVRDLLDSMYKGFPIGYFILWANDEIKQKKVKIVKDESNEIQPNDFIIDGQQRLIGLYSQLDSYKETVQEKKYKLIRKIDKEKTLRRADYEFLHSRINQIEELSDIERNLINKVKERESNFSETEIELIKKILFSEVQYDKEKIEKRIEKLSNLVHYPYQSIQVYDTVSEDVVAEIFTRINSKGTMDCTPGAGHLC